MEKTKIGETTTHKTGDSISIDLPKAAGFSGDEPVIIEQVDEDTLLIRRQSADDTVDDNPWHNGTYEGVDFRQQLEQIGFNIGTEPRVGRELL
ncbi:antitoxin [Secundilactobacillus kimchicus]|nr:antitoxin [Secundilactobacillus kimchicus]MBT9672455.1 antitoxin [Secundilactobacillus kimchicus]